MSHFYYVGVSHKTLPLSHREKLFFSPEESSLFLETFKHKTKVDECLLLSTCNRTELYVVSNTELSAETLQESLCSAVELEAKSIASHWQAASGFEAISHLFQVTASLDSLVLGESQILGQVKNAYHIAHNCNCTGPFLNQLMHRAFYTSKRVRTETGIGLGATSLSSIAVELLEGKLCTRTPPTVLVVGTGKMGAITAKAFCKKELGKLVLLNRTFQTALKLAAELSAHAARWDELETWLEKADVVISCSGSEEPIISGNTLESIMRLRQDHPLHLIDLGVPRDIEENARSVKGISLHNIDDLQSIAAQNEGLRKKEAHQAHHIVQEEAELAHREILLSLIDPTIATLRIKCEEVRQKELAKALSQLDLKDEKQAEVIDKCTQAIIKKILHNPIFSLKEASSRQEYEQELCFLIRKIFQLDQV